MSQNISNLTHVAINKRECLFKRGYRFVGEVLESDGGRRCLVTELGRVEWLSEHWSSVLGVPRDADLAGVAAAYHDAWEAIDLEREGGPEQHKRLVRAWGKFEQERGL